MISAAPRYEKQRVTVKGRSMAYVDRAAVTTGSHVAPVELICRCRRTLIDLGTAMQADA